MTDALDLPGSNTPQMDTAVIAARAIVRLHAKLREGECLK